MLQEQITITNRRGLHARAATKLVKTATQFKADIQIEFDGKSADCKSVMSVLLLAASVNSNILLLANGPDESQALAKIKALFGSNFEEDQ